VQFAVWVKGSRIIPFLQDRIDELGVAIQRKEDAPPKPKSNTFYCLGPSIWEMETEQSRYRAEMGVFAKGPEREHLLTDSYMREIGMLK